MTEDLREYYDDSDYDSPHYSGYCTECGQWVENTVTEDIGIGPYEFWGQKGTDKQLVEVCPYCDGFVEESAGQPCHTCGHYEVEDDFQCELDLEAGGFPGPEKLDRGDNCPFWVER